MHYRAAAAAIVHYEFNITYWARLETPADDLSAAVDGYFSKYMETLKLTDLKAFGLFLFDTSHRGSFGKSLCS